MLITADNDFLIRYTQEFLLLESWNSKTMKFCFFAESCLPSFRISLEFYISKQIAYFQLKVYMSFFEKYHWLRV